jgi:chromosome segregation ATPase
MSELTKEQLLEYVKKQKLKIKKLETELVSLKEKPSEVGSSAPVESEHLKAEVQSLEAQLTRKEAEIASLSKSLEDLDDEKIRVVAKKNAELEQQRELVEEFMRDNANLKEQIQTLDSTVVQLNSSVAHLQSRLASTELQSAAVEEQVSHQQLEAATARGEIARLTAELEEMKTARNLSAGDNEAGKQQLEDLRAMLASEQEATKSTKASLDAELAAHIQTRERFETEMSRLAAELSAVGTERATLAAEMEQLRLQAATQSAELMRVTASHAELQQKLQEPSTPTSQAPSPVPVQGTLTFLSLRDSSYYRTIVIM